MTTYTVQTTSLPKTISKLIRGLGISPKTITLRLFANEVTVSSTWRANALPLAAFTMKDDSYTGSDGEWNTVTSYKTSAAIRWWTKCGKSPSGCELSVRVPSLPVITPQTTPAEHASFRAVALDLVAALLPGKPELVPAWHKAKETEMADAEIKQNLLTNDRVSAAERGSNATPETMPQVEGLVNIYGPNGMLTRVLVPRSAAQREALPDEVIEAAPADPEPSSAEELMRAAGWIE